MLSWVEKVRATAALATGLLHRNVFCNKATDEDDDELLLLIPTTDCHHKYHHCCHGFGTFCCCVRGLRPSGLLISAPCLAEASKLPGGGFGANFAVLSDLL